MILKAKHFRPAKGSRLVLNGSLETGWDERVAGRPIAPVCISRTFTVDSIMADESPLGYPGRNGESTFPKPHIDGRGLENAVLP